MIDRGLYQRHITGDGLDYLVDSLVNLVCYFPDAAASAGYSKQDIADLAWYGEKDLSAFRTDLPPPAGGREGYDRGKRIAHELSEFVWLLPGEPEARAALRKAKASLARHKRNQAKFGPAPRTLRAT
jgi:hypothetical protein